jgi:hypothetical protein
LAAYAGRGSCQRQIVLVLQLRTAYPQATGNGSGSMREHLNGGMGLSWEVHPLSLTLAKETAPARRKRWSRHALEYAEMEARDRSRTWPVQPNLEQA